MTIIIEHGKGVTEMPSPPVKRPELDPDPTADKNELEDAIVGFVKKNSGSKLRGRYFDVTKDEGRREYAVWLAGEIIALNEYIEESFRG